MLHSQPNITSAYLAIYIDCIGYCIVHRLIPIKRSRKLTKKETKKLNRERER